MKPATPGASRNASSLLAVRTKLQSMQQAAESSVTASSFAGLLASLTAPPPLASPEWNDDQLADDVATLSYEPALRTHQPHRSPATDQEPAPDSEEGQSRPDRGTSTAPERSLKRASITIRLNEAECAQIHRRAAEAGLTVSAYLRSCTLEVESLRTQVKETLAQLRKPAPAPMAPFPSRPGPWFRLWSFSGRMRNGGQPAGSR
jgi:hypothetical protein